MVDKYIKSNMCVLPWTSLEVDTNGSASPCCLYKGEIDSYKVYNTDLKTIQNSEYMERLRQQFRNGEKPAGCTMCWQEEEAGKVSKRMNSYYKMKNSLQDWTPDTAPSLKFIDFKLGNICNLKCRICGSYSSSKWAQEELDYGNNPVARQNLKDGGWPKRNPQFFDDIKDVLQDVEYFEFTGGEPMMIENHFKILEHCVEQGYAPRQYIHYNTNGTQLPEERIFWMWSQFKNVEIAFSIDDVGTKFEYQRYGAKWDEVEHNLKQYKSYVGTNNTDFQICSTINIFNILSLDKLFDWVKEFKPKYFHVNTLFAPDCFNIQTLPQELKKIVTDKFQHLPPYRSIINFMNMSDKHSETMNTERRRRIRITDEYRKENFSSIFPELNNFLKIYD